MLKELRKVPSQGLSEMLQRPSSTVLLRLFQPHQRCFAKIVPASSAIQTEALAMVEALKLLRSKKEMSLQLESDRVELVQAVV
ncbi:hypothetical protein NL676_012362 [Syzygium grande]|nr:hypothetical protein NL676_012362 [Syzygium grande]